MVIGFRSCYIYWIVLFYWLASNAQIYYVSWVTQGRVVEHAVAGIGCGGEFVVTVILGFLYSYTVAVGVFCLVFVSNPVVVFCFLPVSLYLSRHGFGAGGVARGAQTRLLLTISSFFFLQMCAGESVG